MKPGSDSHRLFFALNPDEATRASIQAVRQRLEPRGARPVPPQRLHVTLLFLGNQTGARLRELCGIASGIEFPACEVVLDRVGHFPRAAVAWLGAGGVPAELRQFQEALGEAVLNAGIGFDARPWHLHVTLYRKMRRRPETIEFEPVRWRLRGFELMESMPDHNGHEYRVRGHWMTVAGAD